jgi:hypothetical protein
MVSNWSELPDIIEFANQRGIRLFFNTVVFPMEYSLKSLPNALQGEIFDYFNKSARPPVNDIEAGNFSALDGLARQIEFWMRERLPSERTPLQHRCSELLEAGFGARAVQDLLGDLAGRSTEPDGDVVTVSIEDACQKIIDYFRAIWQVGNELSDEGILQNLSFLEQDLINVTEYLNSVTPLQARRMYTEIRRFPREMVRLSGTLSSARLVELLQQHHAPKA